MKRTILIFLTLVAYGEAHDCDTPCPDGKKLVSFVDGNSARCMCLDESQAHAEPPSGCVGECQNEGDS
ncbi:MAG: hypothetical protein N2654_00905 [Deltaproteobacteria bacterium]|nr:hypothetical protein [Deltaproteobacteria bacterium]